MEKILDARYMGSRREAHAYLRTQLGFPAYYGNNLDALYDCLTDMEALDVTFTHTASAEPYFPKVLAVFRDAESVRDTLIVRVVE